MPHGKRRMNKKMAKPSLPAFRSLCYAVWEAGSTLHEPQAKDFMWSCSHLLSCYISFVYTCCCIQLGNPKIWGAQVQCRAWLRLRNMDGRKWPKALKTANEDVQKYLQKAVPTIKGKNKGEKYYRWKSALTGSSRNTNYINTLTTLI